MTLSDEAECKRAASELSIGWNQANSWYYYPKGCACVHGCSRVVWNTHETGVAFVDSKAICRRGGKYILQYCIEISYKYLGIVLM